MFILSAKIIISLKYLRKMYVTPKLIEYSQSTLILHLTLRIFIAAVSPPPQLNAAVTACVNFCDACAARNGQDPCRILAEIISGIATATKLSFPFYLLMYG